jgi:hypothetical protein
MQQMYQEPSFEVGAYIPGTLDRFREKVRQFPSGTAFGWCTGREGGGELSSAEQSRAFDQARDAIEGSGSKLIADPPRGTCNLDER